MRRNDRRTRRASLDLFFRRRSRASGKRQITLPKPSDGRSGEHEVSLEKFHQLTIWVDQTADTLTPLLELMESSAFAIRSMRVESIAGSRTAEVYLRLEGDSTRDFGTLLQSLKELPGVLSAYHVSPPIRTISSLHGRTPAE